MSLDVVILDVCEKEIKKFPEGVIEDFLDAIAKLQQNMTLSMPLSRTMPNLGKGVNELRFKDKDGIYRVIYFIKKKDAIYCVHAFQKKTMKTPDKNIKLAKKRIRSLS